MDTKDFKELSAEEYKRQTRANWTLAPCGSNYGTGEFASKEYFEQVEAHRYGTHPWIKKAIDTFDIKDKDVLEIGFGMGTDHMNLARRGGCMNGIDLTPRNLEVTASRFELYGLKSKLITGDAENLPYPDNSMDFVYSFGVIHHSPDTERIVAEIRRVLKPGGRCWVTVYHKRSIFFWWSTFLVNFLLLGGWRKRSLKQQISLIEYPNTNENMVIRLYNKSDFLKLFGNFSFCAASMYHLLPADIFFVCRFFADPFRPAPFLDFLGKYVGWYIVVDAVK